MKLESSVRTHAAAGWILVGLLAVVSFLFAGPAISARLNDQVLLISHSYKTETSL